MLLWEVEEGVYFFGEKNEVKRFVSWWCFPRENIGEM